MPEFLESEYQSSIHPHMYENGRTIYIKMLNLDIKMQTTPECKTFLIDKF